MRREFPDAILLIKEDNRVTEQTFVVAFVAEEPEDGILPATLQQSTNQEEGYDYSLGEPGVSSVAFVFPPNASSIPFFFALKGDNLTEGTEAFRVILGPSARFRFGENRSTQVFIVDNDGKFYISYNVMWRLH